MHLNSHTHIFLMQSTGHKYFCLSAPESMNPLYVSALLYFLLLGFLPPTGAEESDGGEEVREKRSLPYWGLWSSDFFGWLEELRARAAHDGMQDLARTFWAHFPIGSELGYDSPESDPKPER
ncbi:otospiralin-like isoform X1 [Epinephelus lanceolatus]|uniref:otospiralin isoform X1 n=2 Tax=Epinephelus lanceolatus TaxID=310571 RepID=UPI001446F7C7|nr:otospiralin isoform X1 [Epinephelus lanceolatus]